MFRLFLYLVLIAPLVYGAVWLAEHPGSVSLYWFGYEIQTSIGILLAMSACALVALLAAISVIHAVVMVPSRIQTHNRFKHQQEGISAITQAMSSLAIADHSACEKHIRRAKHYLGDDAPAALLLGAQLAHAKGDKDAVRLQLKAMMQSDETRLVGLRGMIEQAMRDGQPDKAIEYAVQACKAQPKDHWLNLMLYGLLVQQERWVEALELLQKAAKKSALSRQEALRYEAIIHHLRGAQAMATGNLEKAEPLLQMACKRDERFEPSQLALAECYARRQDHKALFKHCLKFWRILPQPIYVELLLEHFSDEAPAKLRARFEQLAATNPEHPESQIALARAALFTGQWETARNQLKVALTRQESPRIYRLLAEVEKAELGDDKQAAIWLDRAVTAPKDALWICESCGCEHDAWQLHCGKCHAFDSLSWRLPVHTPPMVELPAEPSSAA